MFICQLQLLSNSKLNLMTFCRGIILLCFLCCFFPVRAEPNQPPSLTEKVTLQLKWFHQFQFAGFYAAKEQGYYAQEGLDVDILERSPDKDIVKQVTSGEVDFALGDSGILSYYARSEPIIALAAIFQHNPLVFVAKQSTGIISPYEMEGKKVMFDSVGAGDAPLRAILAEAQSNYTLIKQSFNINDLIDDKVDVMSAYLSNEPFSFKEKGVKINIINPQSYGIDFYGDILFTSQQQVSTHPERVEKFRRASLKGWQYALDHPEQLIELIHKKYNHKLSLAHLRFEAEITRKLILPDSIPLGQINTHRLKKVADVYAQLNLSKPLTENDLAKFIYSNQTLNLTEQEQTWLKAHPVISLGIDNNFAPYEWIDSDGNYQGLIADYVTRFEQLLGVKFNIIKNQPWAEILNMAKNEQLDMIAAAVQTPERDNYLNFTTAYTDSPVIIINDIKLGFIGSLSRLNGKKVVVEKAYFMADILKQDYPAIQLVLADNIQDALHQVANGKADAYVGDAVSTNYAISQLGLLNLRFSGNTGYSSSHGVAIIKKHPELLSIMKKVIATIPISEQEQINDRWISLKVTHGIDIKTVLQYALGILLIMLFFVAWNIRLQREVARREKIEQRLRTLTIAIEQSPTSVVITDLDGALLYVNPRFTQVTGYSEQEVLGKNPRILKSGLTLKETYDQLWSTLTQGKIWHGELINRRKNGELYWEEVHIAPVKDSSNITSHYVGVKLDITHRKFLEEKLRFLFESSPLGFALNDLETGNFIEINDAMFTGTGYSKAEFLALSYWDLTPREYEDQEQQQLESLQRTGHYGPYEKEYIRKDGSRYPVLLNGMLMHDVSGHQFIWSIVENITERKQAEMELKKSNIELQQYFNQPFIGMLTANQQKKTIVVNQCFCDMVGYTQAEMQSFDWATITHPDDLALNQAYLEQAIRGEIDFYQMEKRYIHKDGHIVYADLAVNCVRLPNGEPNYFIGMMQDITQRKQMEAEIHIAATAFQSQQGIIITDANHIILKANQAFTQISGYSVDEVLGKASTLLNSGLHDSEFQAAKWTCIQDTGSWSGEIWNKRKNGEIYPEWLTITAIKNDKEEVTHYVATFIDITERKIAEETIKQLAFYDPLTQVPNRRLLQERLEQAIKVSHRTGYKIAVLMMDLDKFKVVNDTLGHAAGDKLLKQVAQRITERLREMDTVARLGGDEFVVIIEKVTHHQDPARIAEAIIHTLSQPFTLQETYQVTIGASIGIALYPEHGDNVEALMDNADTALYQAKNSGRGCFAYFSKELAKKII